MSDSRLFEVSRDIAGRVVGTDLATAGAIDPSIFELIDRIAEIVLEVLDRCLEARRRPDDALQAVRHPTRFQQWRFRNLVHRRLPPNFQNGYVRVADEAMLYAQRASDVDLRELIEEATNPDHILI